MSVLSWCYALKVKKNVSFMCDLYILGFLFVEYLSLSLPPPILRWNKIMQHFEVMPENLSSSSNIVICYKYMCNM